MYGLSVKSSFNVKIITVFSVIYKVMCSKGLI